MFREGIPVYVVAGFLGSGKSTLLGRWLKEAPFSNAALIVNEIGEVGLDHAVLGFAGDASTLLADACVCCTGLPALNEALEQLFWARLHRSIAKFDRVVIETTGLADPGPLVASLQLNALVKERYRIAGTFTTIAAHHAVDTLARFNEARAQLQGADVAIITHTDLVDAQELEAAESALREYYPGTRILHSANASARLADALALLAQPDTRTDLAINDAPFSRLRAHDAVARFIAIDDMPDIDALRTRVHELATQHGDSLIRLKGRVRLDDRDAIVQFGPGDKAAQIVDAPTRMPAVKSGLTLIIQAAQSTPATMRRTF
jgi:G3E family GTPase